MTLVERFDAYAADFERTFVDDDWGRLEPYFTDDAVYATPANGVRVSGRTDVLAVLRAAVSGFDRRCDTRSLASTEGPRQEGAAEVFRRWVAKFSVRGAPGLEIEGTERARYRGDRIEQLEVTLSREMLARLLAYAAAHVRRDGGA